VSPFVIETGWGPPTTSRPGRSQANPHICALLEPASSFDVRLSVHPGSIASSEPDPEAFRLAYEEAKRSLDDQEQAVVELRSRAGTLIAAAAITTSFVGSQALRHHVHIMSWVAIGCFVALGASVLAILWPRRDWEFALSPERFISTYLEPTEGEPLSLPLIHRDLALHMGRSASLNRGQLRWLMVAFRAGALLLMAEVIAWVIVLINQS
jgi:hypothetical protein